MKNKIVKNASWIIACRVVQALLGLAISMLTARYLGPSNFGLVNYAASVVAFAVPLMHLGIDSIMVQEIVSAKEEDEGVILGTGTAVCFLSSILCIFGVIAFSMIANAGERDTIIVVALYSVLLLFQSFEIIQYWFQAKYLSKYTSVSMLTAYFAVSAYRIWLLVSGKSVFWFACAGALDYLLIAVLLVVLYLRVGKCRFSFSKEVAVRMLRKSRSYIISDIMIAVFAQTDRIMIKLMMGNSDAGYYSAAVTCATMANFVFAAILDSSRPNIFESRKESHDAFNKGMIRLYSVVIYFSLLVCLGTVIISNPLVLKLYGEEYRPSIAALQIIVWYTTFAYLGAVRNIWMLAEDRQRYLWIINLLGAGANVILNLLFIPIWGINGAAFASLLTQIFTNVIVGWILPPIRENNRLMMLSLDPRNLTELLSLVRRSDTAEK